MNTNNYSLSIKKFCGLFVLVVCFFQINVLQANAQTATIDATNLVQNTATAAATAATQGSTAETAVSSGSTAASTAAGAASGAANEATSLASYAWDSYGKNMLDAAAYQMAQNLLTKLTNNTVKWIQGGFHGSPSFAVDVKQLATQFADSIAGELILSLRNISVCNFTANYKDDLIKAVEMDPKQAPYTYNKQASCPFNQNYTYKASDFYADFSKGGWQMMDAALSDGGNPYSVQMLTAQEQASRLSNAKATNDQKLSWSNGYTDIVDTSEGSCNYPPTVFLYAGNDDPYNPGTTLTDETANARNTEMFSDPQRKAALQKQYCKTTTPGKVVGDQLTKTLGVNMDRIGFADNMNKIVAAFINVAMESAVRGIFGTGNKSVSTGGTPAASNGGTAPSINISTLAATEISQTAASLNATLLNPGTGTQKVRMWFVLRNADSSVTGAKLFEVTPIGVGALPQNLSWAALGLTPGTTYAVKAAFTTGGVNLVLPSLTTTTTMVNGTATPTTTTTPGNGTFGTELTFSTLP